jgi:hypothetical protein
MSARRWLAVAILAVCLGAPIAESFDWWDQAQPAGDDTETNLVAVALSVGLAVSVAAILVQWFQQFAAQTRRPRWLAQPVIVTRFGVESLHVTRSSTSPLRI